MRIAPALLLALAAANVALPARADEAALAARVDRMWPNWRRSRPSSRH